MELPCDLAQMNADQLRDLTTSLIHTVNQQAQQLQFRQLKIEQLTHEMATLKRWRFARRSEQLDAVQRSLLEESIDADLEAIELELKELQPSSKAAQPPKDKPRRVAPAGRVTTG
jgi:transposase